jgi:hypothetical protein
MEDLYVKEISRHVSCEKRDWAGEEEILWDKKSGRSP